MERYEKIRKIVEKTGISEEDAKAALESCGYDLLDAMIALERAGKIREPRTATYTTGESAAAETANDGRQEGKGEERDIRSAYLEERSRRREEKERARDENKQSIQRAWESFVHFVTTLGKYLLRISLVVDRKDEEIISIPVLLVIVLGLVTDGGILVLVIVGLFFGCRYHFRKDGREWPGERDESDTDYRG